MIEFVYEAGEELENVRNYTNWLKNVVETDGGTVGALCYIFCSDERLREINQEYLKHDYYTDIITFDYTTQKELAGDIFISIDRVLENSKEYGVSYEEELRRVMVHGILHLMGYKDTTKDEKSRMRQLEEEKLNMFHVEQ